jgi:arylamine N-acetyltransferase
VASISLQDLRGASPMRQRLMLRAMTPVSRVTVMNRNVTIRANGEIGFRQLEDRTALRRLLQEVFGFDLPEAEALDRAPGRSVTAAA